MGKRSFRKQRLKGQRRVKKDALHRGDQRSVTVYCPKSQTISLIYSLYLLFLS